MLFEEFLPCRLSNTLRCLFNAVPFQNICDCGVRQDVPQVRHCPLDAPTAPSAVLFGHTNNQIRDLCRGAWPSWTSVAAAIVFLGNQFPMPCQQCLGRDDCGHLSQNLASEFLCSGGQATPLLETLLAWHRKLIAKKY